MGHNYENVISINLIKSKAAGLVWTIAGVVGSVHPGDAVTSWVKCREILIRRHQPKPLIKRDLSHF
ncbi:hypothetical protein [Nostoc sp.]